MLQIDSFYAWSVAGVGSGEMIEPSLLLRHKGLCERGCLSVNMFLNV